MIIFLISFFSYWWGRFKRVDDHKKLSKFIQQFQSLPDEGELKEVIKNSNISEKSWILLAQAYHQNGDYDKNIKIYQVLIEKCKDSSQRKEITFLLGQTYFKAGFLERAQKVFLEILKLHPRTPEVLKYLLLIYEQLRKYNKALEIIEPLNELNIDTSKEKSYIQALLIINNFEISEQDKVDQLLKLYSENLMHKHLIFEYIFRVNSALAWKNLDLSNCEKVSDILFYLDSKDVDLDIISQSKFLRELYSAKALVNSAKSSSIFELDILIKLQQSGHRGVTLMFEYHCDECKSISLFAYGRCPHCYAIDSLRSEFYLTKEMFEKNLSFQ
jgi:tetratricopeptide (TPR) repeat protein